MVLCWAVGCDVGRWGSFEWTGPWCDGHSNWKQFPHVQKKCSEYHETLPDGSPGQAGLNDPNCDDGMFWMEYCDFMTHFTTVDVCHRSRGIADVKLNLHEDYGCVGPAQGCVEGCCSYYLPYCSKQPPHCRGCDVSLSDHSESHHHIARHLNSLLTVDAVCTNWVCRVALRSVVLLNTNTVQTTRRCKI